MGRRAHRTKQQWQRLIASFEASGTSHAEFCAKQQLEVGTFRSWLYRTRREAVEPPVRFAEVETVRELPRVSAPPIRVLLSGGLSVEFGAPPEPEWLAALADALTARS